MSGVAALAVVGGLSYFGTTRQGSSMTRTADTLQRLSGHLAAVPGARFTRGDCKLLFPNGEVKNTACYMSPLKPEVLLPLLRTGLVSLGSTRGWTQDYGVWGAFYALKTEPRRTFGVTIKPIADDLDFEGVKEVQGYESFVTLALNSQPSR